MNGRTAKLIRKAARVYDRPEKVLKRVWYSSNWKQRTRARQEMKQDIARYEERRSQSIEHLPLQQATARNKETDAPVREPSHQGTPTPSRTAQTATGSRSTSPSRWRIFLQWLRAWFGWVIPNIENQ